MESVFYGFEMLNIMTRKELIERLMNVAENRLSSSLGECVEGNDYEVVANKDGKFWINHKEIGSGEPLEQWIDRTLKELTKAESLHISDVSASCPCLHLDEPCQPNCTCVNEFSSAGCRYCCTYGSKEQQKAKAKWIADTLC